MDPESKALLHLVVIVAVWIVLPLLPAWATYRITPSQRLGLKGPFQGLTLNATGSFVAYLVVALLLSQFMWPTGELLIGKLSGERTWNITGTARLYAEDGRLASPQPDLSKAYVRAVPDPHVIDTHLSIKLPFPRDEKPTIYIEVPDWGGGKIRLDDPAFYTEDLLNSRIQLNDIVPIRQQPQARVGIGE
jgi:hypothetical protein